jgi:hypothetical protein
MFRDIEAAASKQIRREMATICVALPRLQGGNRLLVQRKALRNASNAWLHSLVAKSRTFDKR